MRTVEIPVYTYSELSEKAQERAREAISDQMHAAGIITEEITESLLEWLSVNGWAVEPEKLVWSLAYTQGDFVSWEGTRPWEYNGTKYVVRTTHQHYPGGYMGVEADIDFEEPTPNAQEVLAQAQAMASSQAVSAYWAARDADQGINSDDNLAEFAEVNEMEFTEDGRVWPR